MKKRALYKPPAEKHTISGIATYAAAVLCAAMWALSGKIDIGAGSLFMMTGIALLLIILNIINRRASKRTYSESKLLAEQRHSGEDKQMSEE